MRQVPFVPAPDSLDVMLAPASLQDHVAIVTGGGTGIGLAIAQRLGELGARIVVGSRDSKNLEAGTAALRHAGLDPLAVQIDVGSRIKWTRWSSACSGTTGG